MEPAVCHVVVEPEPCPGDWNMALDEALLIAGVERGCCTIRLYRWSVPTLSLGYFQDPQDAGRLMAGDSNVAVVRRLTGGGAILHHHEWTYACVVPRSHALSLDPLKIYDRVHRSLIELLSQIGVKSAMQGTGPSGSPRGFLCHTRRDRFDVICCDHKIVGSAQRRRRGCVLQHGSLLMRASHWAPDFPGFLDLYPCLSPPVDLGRKMGARIASALGTARFSVRHDPRDLACAMDLRNVSIGKSG